VSRGGVLVTVTFSSSIAGTVVPAGAPLVLWWLTYKLPVEREVDDAAIADAAKVARWDVVKIAEIRDAFPVH
jgi:hypothetical protein